MRKNLSDTLILVQFFLAHMHAEYTKKCYSTALSSYKKIIPKTGHGRDSIELVQTTHIYQIIK